MSGSCVLCYQQQHLRQSGGIVSRVGTGYFCLQIVRILRYISRVAAAAGCLEVLASDESINKNNQPHLDLISSNEQQSGLSWTHQTIQTTLLLPVLTHQPFMIVDSQKYFYILIKYLFADGRVCFQYMCYRWNVTTKFRWCSNSGDCRK